MNSLNSSLRKTELNSLHLAPTNEIVKELNENTVSNINLESKKLTSDEVTQLAKALANNTSLVAINLGSNGIDEIKSIEIAKYLRANTTL